MSDWLHTIWMVTFGGDMRWLIVAVLALVGVVVLAGVWHERPWVEREYLFDPHDIDLWPLLDEQDEDQP